ncbi:general secretion pathway protein GspK [Halothermothrix orenii]|uniref:Type II secretory pathway component PulK n=1 Tax=Halothermothrix orenii (strain H 168 / OCM 544 / DSM 9562) TaxID=373903 RepID=B8CZA2_HALOH|nr:type II secretion system protein GspK [Halothermothrix orenii]ACL70621.1 Type II secretory pathway component PulK [Halothermothrix orenii H 168]
MGKKQYEQGYTFLIVIWALVILSIIFVNLYEEVQLNNRLTEYRILQNEQKNILFSAVNIGINKLKRDKTEYDTRNDSWLKPVNRKIKGINYKVKITDVGSRLNINYDRLSTLRLFSWWPESIEKDLKGRVIPDILLLKEVFDESYPEASELLTTLGQYNVNTDRLKGFYILLIKSGIRDFQAKLIVDSLRKVREEKYINKVELLPVYIKGLDLNTFEKIKPFLTTEGRVNINMAPEEVVEAIIRSLDINPDLKENYINKILEYREVRGFKNIDMLDKIIARQDRLKLEKYFGVTSSYFLIKVEVTRGPVIQTAEALVHRSEDRDNKGYKIRILRWYENVSYRQVRSQ